MVAYSPIRGVSPRTTTIGASGGVYGILVAFGMLYGDREIFMFPLPFMMKAKYMVAIMVFLVIIATFPAVTRRHRQLRSPRRTVLRLPLHQVRTAAVD